jgi:hypothetical protein
MHSELALTTSQILEDDLLSPSGAGNQWIRLM